jgi:L-lactate dehydrogenase complex protein LldG
MSDDRVIVYANVRSALQRSQRTPQALPDWDDSLVVSRPAREYASDFERFRDKMESAGGIVLEGWAALVSFIQERGLQRGYVDPALKDFVQQWPATVSTHLDRSKVDDYEFGITRAAYGIAESGTLVLSEARTSSRLAALAPWTHVAVLDRSALLTSIPEAIQKLGDDRATVFVTGPSKTADVEGILIRGVHGPGVQVCCVIG